MSEPNWIEDLYAELAAKDARIARLESALRAAKTWLIECGSNPDHDQNGIAAIDAVLGYVK